MQVSNGAEVASLEDDARAASAGLCLLVSYLYIVANLGQLVKLVDPNFVHVCTVANVQAVVSLDKIILFHNLISLIVITIFFCRALYCVGVATVAACGRAYITTIIDVWRGAGDRLRTALLRLIPEGRTPRPGLVPLDRVACVPLPRCCGCVLFSVAKLSQ